MDATLDVPRTHAIQLSNGPIALIDAADAERVFVYRFRNGATWTGRVCDRTWRGTDPIHTRHTTYANAVSYGRQFTLHRLIIGAVPGQIVDHIDHNGLNCTRANLRFVDARGNARNCVPQKNRSSCYKGVAFHRETGGYEAYIKYDKTKHHLGLFRDEVEAALRYDQEARLVFGEFASPNFV